MSTNRWSLAKIIGLLAIFCLGLTYISGVSTNHALAQSSVSSGGTISFKDKTKASADGNCRAGSFWCADSGEPCYCKPASGGDPNCEVITSTTATYENGQIVMKGGIWKEIAKKLSETNASGAIYDAQEGSVTFTKANANLSVGEYYTSDFLQALYTEANKTSQTKNITAADKFGLIVDIDPVSGSGKILASTRQDPNDPNLICQSIYNGGTKQVIMHSGDGSKHNPCKNAAPFSRVLEGFFNTKNPGKDNQFIFKNCNDAQSLEAAANEIFIPMIGKKISVARGVNSFLGQDFEANECAGGVRAGKVTKIRDLCSSNCPETDNEVVKQALPEYCSKDCQNEKLIDALEKECDKSLSEIMADLATSEDCSAIDARFLDKSNQINYNPQYSENEEEKDINSRAPNAILKMCEETHTTNTKKRVDCKVFANNCVANSISEPNNGGDICAALDTDLITAKWIVCPLATTSVSAADKSSSLLDSLISVNPNIIDQRVESIWGVVRNIAFSIIVIGFLVLLISYITNNGLSNYQIKIMLPKLLISVLLVTISLYLSRLIITVADILGDNIGGLIDGVTKAIPGPQLKIAAIVTGSILTVAAVAGSVILLGGLFFLLVILPAVFIGLTFAVFLLSFRYAAIILLVILAPLAIATMSIPNLDNVFNKWLKMFIACVSVYPITVLILSLSKLTSKILTNASGNILFQLAAFALPALSILLVPKIIIELMRGVPIAGAKLSQSFEKLTGAGWNFGKNLPASQAIRDQQSLKNKQFLYGAVPGDGLKANLSKKSGRIMSKLGRNSYFNRLTGGIVAKSTNKVNYTQSKMANDITDSIKHSPALIRAIHMGSSEGLNTEDRAVYDAITARYGKNSQIFQFSAANAAIINGVSNPQFYIDVYKKAYEQGADLSVIENELKKARITALKNGQVQQVAIIESIIGYEAYTPPKNVQAIRSSIGSSQAYSVGPDKTVTLNIDQVISREVINNFNNNSNTKLDFSAIENEAIQQIRNDVLTGSNTMSLTDSEKNSIINQATADLKSRLTKLSTGYNDMDVNSLVNVLTATTINVGIGNGGVNAITNTQNNNMIQIRKGLASLQNLDQKKMALISKYINQERLANGDKEFVIDPSDDSHPDLKILFFDQNTIGDITQENSFMEVIKKATAKKKNIQDNDWSLADNDGYNFKPLLVKDIKIDQNILNAKAKDAAKGFGILSINSNQYLQRGPAANNQQDLRTAKEKLAAELYSSGSDIATSTTDIVKSMIRDLPEDPQRIRQTNLYDVLKSYDHLDPVVIANLDESILEAAKLLYKSQHHMHTHNGTSFTTIKNEIKQPPAVDPVTGTLLPLEEQPFFASAHGHDLLTNNEKNAINQTLLDSMNAYSKALGNNTAFGSVNEAFTSLGITQFNPDDTREVIVANGITPDRIVL